MPDDNSKRYPRIWEEVCKSCYRLEVPGGWLVYKHGDKEYTMTFLPDPNGEWILKKKGIA